MKRIIIVLIFCTGSIYGYTPDDAHKLVTSTGDLADTQAAITYAEGKAQDGWQIIAGAPGGVYTWNGRLNMVNNYVMTLKGADPANRPVITVNADSTGFGIFTGAYASKTKTVRDIIFDQCTGANGLLVIEGIGDDCFHHENLEFRNMHTRVGFIGGLHNGVTGTGPFGLIDHCHYVSSGDAFSGFYVRQNENSPDNSWGFPGATNAGFTLGTKHAVYFEDNTISMTNYMGGAVIMDGDNSGKVVIRHNHVTNHHFGFHGPDSSGPRQSMMQVEFMHNDLTMTSGQAASQAFFIRGGMTYFFDNSLTGNITVACDMEVHCSGAQFLAEGCRDCGGNVLTAPLVYPTNYPQCQQPGHPSIPIPRIWGNSYTHDESTRFLAGHDGLFVKSGTNYIASDNNSAAPSSGYTEFTYPYNDGAINNAGGTPQAPANVNLPAVNGAATQGQVLTAYPGFWTMEPIGTYTYQWQTCDQSGGSCSNINGATSSSYSQASGDIGHTHRVIVGATNSAGGPLYATSPQNDVTVAPGTENRLTNGGFETHTGAVDSLTNDAAWNAWVVTNYGNGWLQSTTTSHSGAYAFKVQKNTGITVMAIEQPFVPATPGDTMQVSFWEKNSLSGYGVTYYVTDLTHNTNIIAPSRAPDSIGSYTKVETSFIVPAGCVSAKIGFDTSSLGVGGGTYMWLDDVVVAPPATLMSRPSSPQNLQVTPR